MQLPDHPPARLSLYHGGMAGRETFTERFQRLTADLSDIELATAMGMRSTGAARDLRSGDTKMIKLDQALKLVRYFAERGQAVSPWDLIGEPVPQLLMGTGSGKTEATLLALGELTPPADGDANQSVSLTLNEYGSLRTAIEELQATVGDLVDDVEGLKGVKTPRRTRAG